MLPRSKRVPFATIAELLNELSFKEKQEFSPNERRTSKYFNDLKKMRNNFFFNKNLFKLEEDESESDEIDYENSLRKMASNVMLKISSLLELVHTNNGGEPSEYIPFSLEAALLLSALITFDLHDNDMSFSRFSVYCECCKTKIYNESAAIHTMSDVMKSLPDAMFCH